jgi:hypothetical protein
LLNRNNDYFKQLLEGDAYETIHDAKAAYGHQTRLLHRINGPLSGGRCRRIVITCTQYCNQLQINQTYITTTAPEGTPTFFKFFNDLNLSRVHSSVPCVLIPTSTSLTLDSPCHYPGASQHGSIQTGGHSDQMDGQGRYQPQRRCSHRTLQPQCQEGI